MPSGFIILRHTHPPNIQLPSNIVCSVARSWGARRYTKNFCWTFSPVVGHRVFLAEQDSSLL